MKHLLILFFLFSQSLFAQLPITITHSQNKKFSIKSVSYSFGSNNTKGVSTVFKGNKVLYKIDRSFDLFVNKPYFLTISNDGSMVAYLSQNHFPYPAFKNVVIYKKGKLFRDFNQIEFTSCDTVDEDSQFFYDNNSKVFDYITTPDSGYHKIARKGVDEQELFLNKNSVLNHNDTLYFTDSQRMVTVFDVKGAEILKKLPFDSIYAHIRNYKRSTSVFDDADMSNKRISQFKIKGGSTIVSDTLEKIVGMKFVEFDDRDIAQYKLYHLRLSGYLTRDGVFSFDNFEPDSIFDKKLIAKFFLTTRFEAGMISLKLDKQRFLFLSSFRKPLDSAAELQITAKKLEFARRLTLDSINHVYIPRNMEDCFTELDKMLKPETVSEIKAMKRPGQMGIYHHGMGMWIRNNWGLWSGSRLSAYLKERGFSDPDGMSGIIFNYYYTWFKGNKEAYKDFETKYR
ncbi:MAG TPA: DUF6794 domain-containing protein [Pedobacter sp.]|uniref:DUF6794 domain-containing protein n=1 Tax=Pedobacter sp. TaxID=1411316 RepID=UPI002BD261E8|nr:DUF6794 domain-containing protein [Pedobacter sp.]HMI02980.1 DUF6794 domain-containing protein [Pedobacter sp.]